MTSTRKIIGLSALILVALLFMAWLAGLLQFHKIVPGQTALKAATPAGTVLVIQESQIPRELEVLGEVVSKSLAQISAQVPGRVSKIYVTAGARVKPGDILVSLSGEEYQARLKQAQAGARQAQAQLTQARANFERFKYLLQQGAASPQEFEGMQERFQSAQAAVATAQAQIQEAATMKNYTVIRSPAAGVVAARTTAVGDLAQPGQSLLTIYNPGLLQIEGEVNDSFRDSVRLNQTALVRVPAVNWEGKLFLTEIFPISQSQSRTFKVRTGLIRSDRLMPGMFARLSLPLGSTPGILVPEDAVHHIGQLTMVEVLSDNQAQRRQVKLGRHVGQQVEILAGLQPGEKILVAEKHGQ
jgi:membrane fusion protein, multidrug efflux system